MAGAAGAAVWRPLRQAAFRRLYLCYTLAFLCIAMIDVTVAWLIAAQGAPASLVAMVSTAATLPVVALIIPFGALADILSRRRIVFLAQAWAALVALVMGILAAATTMSPPVPLLLVSLFAVATAARMPALTALVPTRVAKEDLGLAMTLLGMASSATRLAGPLVASAIIALGGSALVFGAVAALSILAYLAVRVGGPRRGPAPDLAEGFAPAMRTAFRFTLYSPAFRRLLLQGAAFFLLGAAAFALAPLLASQRFGSNPMIFMAITAAMGAGALAGGMAMPHFDRLALGPLRLAAITLAAGGALVAVAPHFTVAFVGAILHGAGWIWALASVTSAAQRLLPDWIRARGMAITHMATVGGVALGAAFWGLASDVVGVAGAILSSTALMAVTASLPRRLDIAEAAAEETLPHRYWSELALAVPVVDESGPAVVIIDYEIDPNQLEPFLAAQRETRRRRLRSGALGWSLYRDLEDPARFTEHIVFQSLAYHQMHRERTTEADFLARSAKMAMLTRRPEVRYAIAERV